MLYRRMKALACRYWQVAPWEMDQRIKDGQVSFQDIMDLISLLAKDMTVGPWLFNYLSPEIIERIEKEKKQFSQRAQFGKLLQFIKPKNEKEQRFLERLKEEVHKNGT